jgi:hypothetical protein
MQSARAFQEFFSKRTFFILSLSLLFILPAQSQILKVNKGAATIDSSGFYTGAVTLDFAINNRNSKADEQVLFTQFRQKGDISYTSEKHIYYLIDDIRYFKSTGGPLQSTGYGHARANFLRKKRLSYELFAQGQYDQGRNLNARLLAGGGLRYRILEHLAIGIGAMQEQEDWQELGSETNITKNITKLNSYLTGKIGLSEKANISLTGYYQVGYDTDDDIWRNRVSVDASLDIFLAKRFDLSVGYGLSYEDRPIIAISKSVYTFGTGLKYRF